MPAKCHKLDSLGIHLTVWAPFINGLMERSRHNQDLTHPPFLRHPRHYFRLRSDTFAGGSGSYDDDDDVSAKYCF